MAWFKRYHGMYIPLNAAGIGITLLCMLFPIAMYVAVVQNGHSVIDDLYNMFVYTTCTFFWWKWIAEKTATKQP